MINGLWLFLLLSAIALSYLNGTTTAVVNAVTTSATHAVTIAIGLVGIMTFWLGLMRVAENAGLVAKLGQFVKPILKRLFPEIPPEHPAMGAIMMNSSANMLGLGNAATPLGLRAMEQLQKLNPYPKIATNAMCTFLAINTSSIQLIPATVIAILAANGDPNPTSIIFPTLIVTSCSTTAAIITVKCLEKLSFFQYKEGNQHELPTSE